MAEEDLDFILHTGDYIYEGRANGGQDPERVRQHIGQNLYSLDEYRTRYAPSTRPTAICAPRTPSAPFVVSFDDHEVTDNYAGDVRSSAARRPRCSCCGAPPPTRRTTSTMPLRKAALPRGGEMRMYRQLQVRRT